jgi:hypothetical protein
MPLQPGARLAVRFGSRTVLHGFKVMCDGHGVSSHGVAVEGRVAAGDMMLELALDVGEQA